MNKIIQGNILDIQRGVIAHQVNCQYKAGAGLALQIRRKWPAWYGHFGNTEPMLGVNVYFQAEPELVIVNMYSQDRYGRGEKQTDYAYLERCLRGLKIPSECMPVYLPYGLGCGLGGGDWNVVSSLIYQNAPSAILVKL